MTQDKAWCYGTRHDVPFKCPCYEDWGQPPRTFRSWLRGLLSLFGRGEA